MVTSLQSRLVAHPRNVTDISVVGMT